MLNIFQRSTWGARHPNGFGSRSLPATRVILHHSVTQAPPTDASLAQDYNAVRILENIGQSRFGGGISYNYAITPAGRVFEGVSVGRIGAHTRGYNTTGIGIVLVGNYENSRVLSKQYSALVKLVRELYQRGHVTVTAPVVGHRSLGSTACPGRHAFNLISSVQAEARTSAPSRPEGVADMSYRHVAGWAEDAQARALVEAECRRQGVRYTVDGPAFEFHANLEKVRAIEAVVARNDKLHRFHGVPVTEGTHSGMGVADGIGSKPWVVAVGVIDDWKRRFDRIKEDMQAVINRN